MRKSVLDPVRRAARLALHVRLRYHQGRHQNIVLISGRRSGSTLLAEMIASEPGMWFVNEPFGIYNNRGSYLNDIKSRWLPPCRQSQRFDLDAYEADKLLAYTHALCRAEIPLGRILGYPLARHADRVLLKVINAPFLCDWLVEACGLQAVFLIRHPAPQALSVLRHNWKLSCAPYIEASGFLERHMGGGQAKYARDIFRGGTPWQRAILNWVCETYFPLMKMRSNCLHVTYEDLVMAPEDTVQRLCAGLHLTRPERMLATLRRPSRSARMSSPQRRAQITSGVRTELVRGWQAEVTERDMGDGQAVLDAFGIGIYRMDDPMPFNNSTRGWTGPRALPEDAPARGGSQLVHGCPPPPHTRNLGGPLRGGSSSGSPPPVDAPTAFMQAWGGDTYGTN